MYGFFKLGLTCKTKQMLDFVAAPLNTVGQTIVPQDNDEEGTLITPN